MDTQIEQATTGEVDEFIEKLEPSVWKALSNRLRRILGRTEPVHRISLGLLVAILALIINTNRQVFNLGGRVNGQDAKIETVRAANLATSEQVAVLKKRMDTVERHAAASDRRVAKLTAQVTAMQKQQAEQNGQEHESRMAEPETKSQKTFLSQ
jgi:hypothetical protein